MSHVASTYAAILAVVNIGTEEAYQMVDVEGMKRFLLSMKNNLTFQQKEMTSGWNLFNSATGE